MLNVCLLGCGGHAPIPGRRLTSLLLNYPEKSSSILIDCGEGTQVALLESGWKFNDIDCICLTHLHTDHIAGLPGLLASMKDNARNRPLTILGPRGLQKIVDAATVFIGHVYFNINVIEVAEQYKQFVFTPFKIQMKRVFHSCSCYAYRITALRGRNCLPELAEANGVPIEIWSTLLEQNSAEYKGKIYYADQMSQKRGDDISISYCTDTRPVNALHKFVSNSDLLVAEGMYYDTLSEKAEKYKHMTYSEAAAVARDGKVKELWLTHFSPAIRQPKDYLREALPIFANTQIGTDGKYEVFMFKDKGAEKDASVKFAD